jgi:predicted dehydrogenase
MTDRIGVGIIGANPDHSWASWAHIPALATLPDYELRAVSTSRAESAAAAAARFNVPAFDNHAALLAHPGVELVVVAVKVLHHRALVLEALEAGKHVYCDWPLGNGLDEAIGLAEAAARTKVRTAIGLQARAAPVINRLRDLIADGYVGKVLSTSVVANSAVYGGSIGQTNTYMLDATSGANMLTIQIGHLADAMAYCLGEFRTLTASLATMRPQVTVTETGQVLPTSTPDQIALTGILHSGAVASVHLRGGRSRGTNLLWEINGTKGDLQVTGPSSHISNDEAGEPTLRGGRGSDAALAALPIPDQYRWVPSHTPKGPAFNVAQLYTQLASDIRDGTNLSPTFDIAVRRHRMLGAIQKAAETGTRQGYEPSFQAAADRPAAGVPNLHQLPTNSGRMGPP